VATGKRAGARPQRRFRPDILGLTAGITLLVVAWGYLVYAAIDFGGDARGGDDQDWIFLALASIGAIACLFAGLMLIARLFHALTHPADSGPEPPPGPGPSAPSRHRADVDPQ